MMSTRRTAVVIDMRLGDWCTHPHGIGVLKFEGCIMRNEMDI